MSAHAILSLRGRKYGDEWAPVWEHLGKFGFEQLEPHDAAEQVIQEFSETSREHDLRNVTALELIRDAAQTGLRLDHIKQLATTAADGDEDKVATILNAATDKLGWNLGEIEDWDQVRVGDEAIDEPPTLQESEAPTPEVMADFHSAVENVLPKTSSLALEICRDETVPGGIDGATTVYGEFEMDAALDDLRYATNPENWPDCSWFFLSMTGHPPVKALPDPDNKGAAQGFPAYQTVFEELVGIDQVFTVRTSLTTRYFVGAESVGMEFDLAPGVHGDGKLDVDHGYLLAEVVEGVPNRVRVKSQKTFSFVGLNDLPFSFLCEFGWIDMMRAMAECRP